MAWQSVVHKWYPKLHEQTYFVPPVQMNRVQYVRQQVGDETVSVPLPPVQKASKGSGQVQLSDLREDEAQQRILYFLKVLANCTQPQVMFVLSRLKFNQYLDEPCYIHSGCKLPRPHDLKKQGMNEGDFDMLIIHRHYGLVAVEIKSVGYMFPILPLSREEKNQILLKKIQRAIKQLNKSFTVLTYMLSDLTIPPRVRKCLMLPNISLCQLQQVLEQDAKTNKELCQCLDTADPLHICLTSDSLPADGHKSRSFSPDILHRLRQWWTSVMVSQGNDPAMTEGLYDELLARFVGPATRVEMFAPNLSSTQAAFLRSEGQGVQETARRLTKDLILHPEQIQAINCAARLVYLTGPPGTGKTVVLLLKGQQWMREGHDVHVVSMYDESIAASKFVENWLKYRSQGRRVYRHLFDIKRDGPTRALHVLTEFAADGQLHVLIDEVDGSVFEDFSNGLNLRIPKLYLWAARMLSNMRPRCITDHYHLSKPLRCPAVVVTDIQRVVNQWLKSAIGLYDDDLVQHCEGPALRNLYHRGGEHGLYAKPIECEACGGEVAALLHQLHVNEILPGCTDPELQYRDVFILTSRFGKFTDRMMDLQGNEVLPACGLVRGLRNGGVPVRVVGNNTTDLEDVSLMTGENEVVASSILYVNGLERKIVVWVQCVHGRQGGLFFDGYDRLQIVGRCCGQLINILWPDPLSEVKRAVVIEPDLD